MTPSQACIDFIKGFEACRLDAYLPTPDDAPTIGFGSTGPDITLGMTWTQTQADDRFASDLAAFAAGVSAAVTSPTTQGEFDAMVSFAYNVGLGAFEDSTLLRLHNASDYANVPSQFGRWNKQNGKVLAGLTRRRAAEASMYAGAIA